MKLWLIARAQRAALKNALIDHDPREPQAGFFLRRLWGWLRSTKH
ncbi:hypothetical protein [Mesorhizobium sp. M0802]